MFQVVGHAVEIYTDVAAGMGHGGGAHRPQLGLLAAPDRDAHVHPHGVQRGPEGRRRAVRVAVLRHVPAADPGAVRGRPAEQAPRHHVDRVQETVELDIHVGRGGRSGRPRLPGEHHDVHNAVRGDRGRRVHDQRRVQHQPHGPVAQLRRRADGHHEHGRVLRRYHRSPAGRIRYRRRGKNRPESPVANCCVHVISESDRIRSVFAKLYNHSFRMDKNNCTNTTVIITVYYICIVYTHYDPAN